MANRYSELLKDPRWQKKRLEVFNRDNFTCRYCGNDKDTLNVHHLEYRGYPWEVPLDKLITSCQKCHKLAELIKDDERELKKVLHYDIAYVCIVFYNRGMNHYIRCYWSDDPDCHGFGEVQYFGPGLIDFISKALEDFNNG